MKRVNVESVELLEPWTFSQDLGEVATDNIRVQIEIQDLSKQVDELQGTFDALESLTSLYSKGLEAVDNGHALTPLSARMLQIAYESVCPLEFRIHKQVVPALENFSGQGKTIATRIAFEGIGDSIQKLAWRIADWITALWEKIVGFLKRVLFDRNTQVQTKLKAAKQEIDDLPHDAKPAEQYLGTKTVSTEDINTEDNWLTHHVLFGIKGRCDANTTHEIVDNTTNLIQFNREVIVHILECMNNLTDEPPSDNELEAQAAKLVDEIKSRMSKFTLLNKKMEGNITSYSYGHFHDSSVFKLKERIGLSQDDTSIHYFNVEMDVEKIKDIPYRVRVLSIGEMGKLVVETGKLSDRTADFKNVIPIAERILQRATHTLQIYHSKISDQDSRETIQHTLNMVMDLFKYVGKHLPSLATTSVRTAQDVTTYVHTSIAKHKRAQA